jgi:hypothetical protein
MTTPTNPIVFIDPDDPIFSEHASELVDVGLSSDSLDVEPDEETASWMRDLDVPNWVL